MRDHDLLSDAELAALREAESASHHVPRVLLVDDDEVALAELGELVESAGLSFFVAGTAAQAMQLLQAEEANIDLVVTDLRMEADDSGLALVRELNAGGNFLPIIVLSGNAGARDVVEAMRLNVLDFMLKPIDPDYFLDQLASHLVGGGGPRRSE